MRSFAYALALALLAAFVLPVPTVAQTTGTPTITSISPDSVPAGGYIIGSGPLMVLVTGKGFTPKTTAALANGRVLRIEVDATGTQAKVYIPLPLLESPVKLTIVLANPRPAGSASIAFSAVARVALATPTPKPTVAPTPVPTPGPTTKPTVAPTAAPTLAPTPAPTVCPPAGPSAPGLTIGNLAPSGPNGCSNTLTIAPTSNGVPVLSSISPTSAAAGSSGFLLALSGANFSSKSTINIGGLALSPASSVATALTAVVPPSAMTQPGTQPVFVTNPAPGGGTSQSISFTITAAPNPVPSLSNISPPSLIAGGPATSVTVIGTGFLASTTGILAGLTGTVTGNTITFNLPAGVLANPGSLSGLVSNPSPGGGTQSFTVIVLAPPPTVTAFSPPSAIAGAAAVPIQVSGTNFRNGSTITFAGTPIPTTFLSATSLSGVLTESFLRSSGNYPVGVINSGSGGAAATARDLFSISNTLPVLTSVSPAQLAVQNAAATVTLTGTGFAANSSAYTGTTNLATVYISATALSVTIPPSLLQRAGTLPITITNPAPGGGTSAAVSLVIAPAP